MIVRSGPNPTVTAFVALSLDTFSSPPPEMPAVLVSVPLADAAMATVAVIAG
jgi:hypothetical protein